MYGRSLNWYVYARPFKQGLCTIYERTNYKTVEIHPWDSPFRVERDDTTNIRDFKIPRRRRQWERQKSNRFKKAWYTCRRVFCLFNRWIGKTHVCTCITLFCPFLCRYCTTTTGKCLMSRFSYGGLKQATAKFSLSLWTWIWFLGIWLKKSSPAFEEVNELE